MQFNFKFGYFFESFFKQIDNMLKFRKIGTKIDGFWQKRFIKFCPKFSQSEN